MSDKEESTNQTAVRRYSLDRVEPLDQFQCAACGMDAAHIRRTYYDHIENRKVIALITIRCKCKGADLLQDQDPYKNA
jgi:hypothetical protein